MAAGRCFRGRAAGRRAYTSIRRRLRSARSSSIPRMKDVTPFRDLVLGGAERRELLVRQLGGGEASRLDEVDPVVQPSAAPRDLVLLALETGKQHAELGVGERRDVADVGQ